MEKESNQKESEAQLFLNEAVAQVKEFINGHPNKDVIDRQNKIAKEQRELANIRAIRESAHTRNRSRDFEEEKDNGDKNEDYDIEELEIDID